MTTAGIIDAVVYGIAAIVLFLALDFCATSSPPTGRQIALVATGIFSLSVFVMVCHKLGLL